MSRRSSPKADPPTRAAAAAAVAVARSRARACDRSRALWRYATAARTTAARTRTAPRRNVGELLKTQTKTTNLAHARMWHFDKNNKQKPKNAVISAVRKMAFEPTPFWASSACWFPPKFPPNTQHRDERIPRTQVTYAAFPSRGVLGDNSTVKTQPKWCKTEPLLKGHLLPRQNRISLTQIHHSFS